MKGRLERKLCLSYSLHSLDIYLWVYQCLQILRCVVSFRLWKTFYMLVLVIAHTNILHNIVYHSLLIH